MPKIVFSLLVLCGSLVALTGLLMRRRAMREYGRAGTPRGVTVNASHWLPAWRVSEMFSDPRGMRSYLKGDAFFGWGMTVVWFALGFIAGRW